MSERILSLDITTLTGWAYGAVGEVPRAGAVRFAPSGASHGEIGRGFLRWFTDFIAVSPVDTLFYEVPLDPRWMGGKTNFSTARIVIGLPFLLETVASAKSINRIREVTVNDVRKVFIGKSPKKGEGKLLVQEKCRALGWKFADDNAADALALWAFACKNRAPGSSLVKGGEPCLMAI